MTKESKMKTIDNIRASVAYGFAKEGISAKEYKAYVKKIPMYIKTNGLGATIAFMLSKKKTYLTIYKQIDSWFKNPDNPHRLGDGDFQEQLLELDSKEYRIVTAEVMALFTWLRRFAEGLAKEESNEPKPS